MKVVMVMVSSLNGKITKGDDSNIYKWTSREDQDFFAGKIKESNLIVMGAQTYEAAKKVLKPSPERLRIVITRNPGKYSEEQIPGQLEFTKESPKELIARLSSRFSQMLLVGGGVINSFFLKENLVDEIYLTIEPVIFGKGKDLTEEGMFENRFKLLGVEKLNQHGTILVHYKVDKV